MNFFPLFSDLVARFLLCTVVYIYMYIHIGGTIYIITN